MTKTRAPAIRALPTVKERRARGAAARVRVPREEHAAYSPAAGRADPVAILESQARSRVPELVPIRYGRMLVSPFAFYRGAAAVMTADLAPTPVSGITTQICGDAHLMNFGLFGSPERSMLFDINDFDETYPGPWEWDVKRLAASLVVAARGRGFAAKQTRSTVAGAVRRYREAMIEFAAMGNLDVWYARADVDRLRDMLADQLSKVQRNRLKRATDKAHARDSVHALAKLTTSVDGGWRINADPPFIMPVSALLPRAAGQRFTTQVAELTARYRATLDHDRGVLLDQYEFVDLARKVVGVGSVGTRSWILLLRGRDTNDPLFLQVKEAQRSVLADYLEEPTRPCANEGERVVFGQRLMQAASDIFLGWVPVEATIDGQPRDFYVRQLRDWKGSADIDQMVPAGLDAYAGVCAWTLARAHARSGDRIAIAAYLGKSRAFDVAVADFAERYADQNERDHSALAAAAQAGRISTATRLE